MRIRKMERRKCTGGAYDLEECLKFCLLICGFQFLKNLSFGSKCSAPPLPKGIFAQRTKLSLVHKLNEWRIAFKSNEMSRPNISIYVDESDQAYEIHDESMNITMCNYIYGITFLQRSRKCHVYSCASSKSLTKAWD